MMSFSSFLHYCSDVSFHDFYLCEGAIKFVISFFLGGKDINHEKNHVITYVLDLFVYVQTYIKKVWCTVLSPNETLLI